MSGVARIGDIVISLSPCGCHKSPKSFTGVILTGSSDTISNSSGTAVIGSIASSSCGHIITLLTGSGTVLVNNKGTHRIGDIGTNCGGTSITVGGSNNILVGG